MPDPTRQSLSATETPQFFGVSPYGSRWTLYLKFRHGIEAPDDADERMTWGKEMQPILLKRAAAALKLVVMPNDKDNYIRRGLLGCTRDATVICPTRGPGALETKCVFDYSVWMNKWGGGESPPPEMLIQLQQQMYVGDGVAPYQWGVLSPWVCGEQKFMEYAPNLELWTRLRDGAEVFFDDVANTNEPDPLGIDAEKELLLQCFPTVKDTALDLRLDEELLRQMRDIQARGGVPEAEMLEVKRRTDLAQEVAMMKWHGESRLGHARAEDEIKARLLALAKGAESILLPYGVTVTIKEQSRAGYTVKPTSFQVVKAFVPHDAPRGDILGLEPTGAKNGE